MRKFSNSVIEKIQYYVYILIDPRDQQIFYIGKWKWNRVFSHINWAIGWDKSSQKIAQIHSIISSWSEVKHYIVRHGLTEKESLEVEWALIDFYWKSNLTNIVLWHNSSDRWIMNIDEININYDAEDIVIKQELMLININSKYYFWISKEELYQITRKTWKANLENAQKFKYVLCHYHWIVREVYEVDEWYKSSRLEWRIEFYGQVATSEIREKYQHKSISNYFKKWSQNPIKYITKKDI